MLVQVVSLEKELEPDTVYNIEVADFHTYFVGELKVLVHNDNCGNLEIVIGNQGGNHARWVVDGNGHPLEVSGKLTEDFGGAAAGNFRSSLEEAQALLTGRKGLSADEGGHLIAHRFMKDQGLKNLFPQNGNFNRGSFKVLENDYARALRVPGTEISFSHKLSSFDDIGRPNVLKVRTNIFRGGDLFDRIRHTFSNETGTQYTRRY
ncbi:DNA/RNA non-specific endonuclease [Motilimonas cestriensis]|uniref:DNA/RNA non-specific endonuclease n=2 Tax=Motilimonas cestriensis TaxID=2742685 RepID=A0ABS8WHX6_9GAMM|nr:DNA/RNA non-specific endonuclease [Motilimonas cestriensis]